MITSDGNRPLQLSEEEAEHPAAVTAEASRIQEVTLKERRTEKDISVLVARIDSDGDLVLEGHDVGEAPREFWGDDDYEFWRVVKKDYKDQISRGLIQERFHTKTGLKRWFDKKGIPIRSGSRMIPEGYRDTVLLWLIKERFDSDTDFKHWLDKKGIPGEFGSWV